MASEQGTHPVLLFCAFSAEEEIDKVSEKMYKSRIRKWTIDKKRKRPEMLSALKTIESRRQRGKLTRVTIRGH